MNRNIILSIVKSMWKQTQQFHRYSPLYDFARRQHHHLYYSSIRHEMITRTSQLVTQQHLQQRRWMGAPSKHNRKKKVEKEIPEKEIKKPIMTDKMKDELALLEKRFERLDKERFGRNRGIECARQIVLEEKLEKRATKACANIYLNNWLYRRYALRLGYSKITDVPGDVLANTLIREGTDVRFYKYKNPKTIIKELYRYDNKSPMKERYLLKDRQLLGTEYDPETLNFDNPDEFLTPYEEEEEKILLQRAMLNPTLYKENPTKERREEKIRSNKRKTDED